MALIEKITQEDLALYEILKNPVLCAEFIYNIDKTEYDEPFLFDIYQREMVADFNPYVSFCTARAIGKTVSLVSIIMWILIFKIFPQDYILYTVPSKVHLEPVWTGLVRNFRSNSFLKHFIAINSGINSSEYSIKLLNQTSLLCRIAGQSGTGANLIGLHTPFILLDEGGYFPWNAFQEMQPSLNTWTPGSRELVAGVPTGLRENNVLYHVDQENSSYTKHRISALQNSRVTAEDKQRALDQYGGVDSDDYMHYFLGVHGKPVFALFDRTLFSIGNDPVHNLELNGLEYRDNILEYINKLLFFPGLPTKDTKCIIGIDLGYTEPTAITILYLDNTNRLHFHGKIKITKGPYPIQEKFIDELDSKFKPLLIGVDKGNAGMSVFQHLMLDPDYASKNYAERLIAIDFSGSVVIGIDEKGEELKDKTKPFAVSILQSYCNNHRLIFSHTDLDMISELERMTYSKNPTGDIVYKTMTVRGGKRGSDHFTSALLCAVTAYHLENEFLMSRPQQKKLFRPTWVQTGN